MCSSAEQPNVKPQPHEDEEFWGKEWDSTEALDRHRPLHRWLGPRDFRSRFGPRQYTQWLKELGCVEVVARGQGLYPPLFHRLSAAPRRMIERVFRPLAGTWLAGNKLGYYFSVSGRRAV